MGQATWQYSAFDPNTGQIIDFLDAFQDAQYTRRLDDYCDLQGTITHPDDFFSVQPFSSGVMAMRDGVPRFRGRVVEPFERSPRQRKFIAKDPFHNLYWRRIRKHIKYTNKPDEIAWNLIHLQNTYKDTGIRDGADGVWGSDVTRKFGAGEIVSDTIKALAKTTGQQYHFRMNASYDEHDIRAMAAIQTFHPVTKDDIRFEFGGGTLENCADYQVEYGQVVNRATVIGASRSSRDAIGKSTSDGNCVVGTAKATPAKDPPITASYVAGESEHDYGLWEDEYGQTGVHGNREHLENLAKTLIYKDPPKTVTVTPNEEGPALFSDFDVGDRVHVRIHDYDFTLEATYLVYEVVVDIDPDSGQEAISTISFINPQDTSA